MFSLLRKAGLPIRDTRGLAKRTRAALAGALALILVSPFLSVAPAANAVLVPVVIDLAKVTSAPVDGTAGENESVTFDFTVTCSSTQSDCVNLQITDSFPTPLVFDSVNVNTAYTIGAATNGFLLTFIKPLDEGGLGLVAGETVTFQAIGHVMSGVDASFNGVQVTNTAYATVDNPDSATEASDVVGIVAPAVIQSTVTKSLTPSTIAGFPGTDVAIVLGASNTSNIAVDTLTIQDPATLPSNAFQYLEVSSLGTVTFPSGANRVQIDYYDGASWILGSPAATAVLPAVTLSTIKGLRFTFSNSSAAVDIARNASASITLNTKTNAAVASLVTPFSGLNQASSQAVLGGTLGTIVGANAPFTITPAAVEVLATKVFSQNDVLGGDTLKATLTAQNSGDFTLTKLTVLEPETATTSLADQGLQFVSIDQANVFWPIGATSVDITYAYDDVLPSLPQNGVTRDALPAPDPLRTVIGFSATFNGTLLPGQYGTIPFTVQSLVTLSDAITTNTIRVTGETSDARTAFDLDSDDLVRRSSRIRTSIVKYFTPDTIYANAGQPLLLSLNSQIDPRPTLPTDTGGSTVGATLFEIEDSDAAFWDDFDAAAIVATEVPTGSTLEIRYSTDGGATYPGGNVLVASTVGPATVTSVIPVGLRDSINGILFSYTPTTPGTLLPPGFNVQPNIKVKLRATERVSGDPVIEAPATSIIVANTATTYVENSVTGDNDADSFPDEVNVLALPGGGGPGFDMIAKDWQDVVQTGFKAVQARSSQQATATISWGTAGQEYASVVISDTPDDSSTAADDPTLATLPTTVYDTFDLVRIPAITGGMDPLIQYDAVQAVQYFSLTSGAWLDLNDNGNPCAGSACYGTFPGYTLSTAESADAIGVRLVFIERPDRTTSADPFAPLVGSGVAATSALDRQLYLTFQVRNVLRSDPSTAIVGGGLRNQLYNTATVGEVNNVAAIEARDDADAVLWAESDDDQIIILPSSIDVRSTKTWVDGPLGVPPLGTPQSLFPMALMTVTAQNASVVPVDELKLDEPTGGTNPFDYVNIVQIEKLVGSTDTTSTIVLHYASAPDSAAIPINTLVTYSAVQLQDVVGLTMVQAGAVPTSTIIGLQLHTQLREFIRGGVTRVSPSTVNNETTATVTDPGGTTAPPLATAPNNVVTDLATASIDIEAWVYGVRATKAIAATTAEFGTSTSTSTVGTPGSPGVPQTAAIQYDNGEATASNAVVTLTGQPTGNVRTTDLVIEDSSPTFWNAYNFLSLDTTPLTDTRKRVQVDVLLGYSVTHFGVEYTTTPSTISSSCTGDPVNDCWVLGTPGTAPALPTLPGGAVNGEIRGLRFTYTNADGSAWERPYNPIETALFSVDRRTLLVSPDTMPVPSTLFTFTDSAPGESSPGIFTDDITVVGAARDTIGSAALWSASADASAQVQFQHLPARVKIKKSPVGAQSLATDIPYKIVVTNTGGAYDKPFGEIVVTDSLPVDISVLPVEPQLIIPNDPDTGLPYDINDIVSVRVANAANATQTTPSFTTVLQPISGDHQDIVFTFDSAWELPRQWTITITVPLQFTPQLEAGTDVVNTATVVADQPFETCEWYIDNATAPETARTEVDDCYSSTTVYPLASAPVTIIKGVRGVDAGPLDLAGDPIEESPGDPYDDLGILKTVPTSAVTCASPNVSVGITAEYYRYPCVPITRPGGIEEWASTFTNGGNIGLTDLVAIDVLPAPGDKGVIVNEARNSKWTPTLTTYPTLVDLPTGATYSIYYLTNRAIASQRCNGADIQASLGMLPAGDPLTITGYPPMTSGYVTCYTNTAPIDSVQNRNTAWTLLSPAANAATLASVVAMKFVIAMTDVDPLLPGDKVSIVYRSQTAAIPEVAETGVDIDNQSVAYNSIAAAAAGFDPTSGDIVPNRFVTEPRKVGVAMATGSIQLQKTVTGAAGSYSQSSFSVDLSCISAGVTLPTRTEVVPKGSTIVVHGLPLYADCAVSESSSYNQNPNTSSISPTPVMAQAPQTAGLETILDPNPVFGPTRPTVELSTITNDYPVTTFTITKTINNNGALNGEGGSATSVYPNDLRFSAVCTFNNGDGVLQSVLNVSNQSLNNGGTYTSPSIPVGSSCTVTETSSRAAQSTTRIITVGGVAGAPVTSTSAVFVVDDSGNSVAYTNNYAVASLTVNKSIIGAWYTGSIGAGEQSHPVGPFTVNIACTRQLNTGAVDPTYAASVVLDPTVVGGLTHTFNNIIQGSNCTVTESVTGGATTVALTNGGVVNGISGSASAVTVTNTFSTASLAVTKTVLTTAVDSSGDVVYLDAPYTVLVSCTFRGAAVYGTGYLPNGAQNMTVSFSAAELLNAKTYTKTIAGLPAGASCVVTESPTPANASDVIIDWTAGDGPDAGVVPDSGSTNGTTVTVAPLIADGQPTANTATIKNYYDVGHFTVDKQVLGGDPTDQFGTGPFTIHVTCVSGVTTTFDDDIVLPLSGGQLTYTIDNIGVGSECSATETNFGATGADALVYSDPDGDTTDGAGVDVMGTDPRVVIENWYYTGSLQVTKTLGGLGDPAYSAGPFEVTLVCVRDVGGTPVTATLDTPVRIMDPATPSTMTTTFTHLPNGAVCTLTETDDGSATSSSISDGATTVSDVAAGFTFTVDADSPTTTSLDIVQPALDVTNTFDLAGLTVTKFVDSSAFSSLGVPYGPFPVTVDCTFQGLDVYATGYDVSTPMAKDLDDSDPWQLDGLPAGAVCVVTETDDLDAIATTTTVVANSGPTTGATGTTATLTLGASGSTNSVGLTNYYDVGSIELSKVVDGLARDDWGTGVFAVTLSCEFTDASGTRTVWDEDYEFSLATTLGPVLVEDLPTGSVCTIDETATGTATTTQIDVDGTLTTDTTATATITNDVDPLEAVITNTFDYTSIEVTKDRTGAGLTLYGDGPFEVSLSCTFDGASIAVPGGATRSLDSGNTYYNRYDLLPVGADCVLDETLTFGANTVVLSDGSTTVNSGLDIVTASANSLITVTNDYEVGSLTVTKTTTGLGSSLYGDGSSLYGWSGYEVTLECERDVDGVATAVDIPGGAARVLDAASSYVATYDDLPVGAVCDIVETKKGFATTSTPSAPVTITASGVGTVSIDVVNDFQLGTLALGKSTLGLFAARHAGQSFEISVECWQDVDGTPTQIVPIAGGETRLIAAGEVTQFIDLPVPAECTFDEIDGGGADLAVYSVASVPMAGSTVTVANGDTDVGLANLFTLAHTGTDADVWLLGALVMLLSGVALVVVSRRRERAVISAD